jgi:hypothetical protein
MRQDLWAHEAAKRLWAEHRAILKKWKSYSQFPPERDLEIWLRDNCCCVYCGRNLLPACSAEAYTSADRDVTYFCYCYDHLLPKEKKQHHELKEVIWNNVLSCHACNSYKSTFDPSSEGIPANEAYRDKLIERAKVYIQEQRKSDDVLFMKERELILAALQEYEANRDEPTPTIQPRG